MNNPNFKRFASKMIVNNPYHHDFVFENATYFSLKKLFFASFDLLRIFFYVFVLVKVGMKAPQYILFKKNNYLNNPDFMLVNQAEYEKIKNPDSAVKN